MAKPASPPGDTPQKVQQSKHHAGETRLTKRQLHILEAILIFGGVLTTRQVSTCFFLPDLKRRLIGWGISGQQADEWMAKYPLADLNAKIECLKWCQRLAALGNLAELPRKADAKLNIWLQTLRAEQQAVYRELEGTLKAISNVSPADWLIQAVEKNADLPKAFELRPRLPSDSVSSACKAQLRYLREAGLIEPQEQAVRLADGRLPLTWFLTRTGRNKVAQMRQVQPNDLDWKPVGSYGQFHLTHRLALNDFRIAVELACRQRGYTIRRWVDDNELKRLLEKEKVVLRRLVTNPQTRQTEEVEEMHALKIPDGFFWLDLGNGRHRCCFFEFDNQTLTLDSTEANTKDYAHKIRTISAFYRHGRYKEVFPEAGDSMWYLTVTSGTKTRLENLKQTTERVIGKQTKAIDRYWFALNKQIIGDADYFSATVFTPIWWRAGQERLWSLDEII